MEFLYIVLIVFAILGVSFILLNLRNIVTGKEFRGTCATNNPMLKNNLGDCPVCGKAPHEDCKKPETEKFKIWNT